MRCAAKVSSDIIMNMKMALFLLVLFISIFSACAMQTVESQKVSDAQKPKTEDQLRQPVLVELFTSEGCSSCPPADKILAYLERQQPATQAEIITLALHVDYWDYIGWKDEFASPLYSQRQELYGQKFKLESIYTPQMIVDGETEFVGNEPGKAVNTVIKALNSKKANVEISRAGEKVKIKLTDFPVHEESTVYFVVAEDNLSNRVKRGENSGQKLEHISVARELKSIGLIDAKTNDFAIETDLTLQPKWETKNLKIIIFAQENASRKIWAVNRIKY